jgi:hypothetical protein
MRTGDVVAAIEAGQEVGYDLLERFPDARRDELILELLESPTGRRWLRAIPDIEAGLADALLRFEEDFRTQRRDATLALVVQRASESALREHATQIAAGPAGQTLWQRLAGDPQTLTDTALAVVRGQDGVAAEATLYLLVVDPLDPYGLGRQTRARIAAAALESHTAAVRGAAAEFLASHAPEELLATFDALIHDRDERVRGIVWNCALRLARADARDLALGVIGDETTRLQVRRSALIALGTVLPTSDMVDLLSLLVVHPVEELALDAALLLHDYHRHPTIATAAQQSPHEPVRNIAEALLDPLRGSPAAGGSRPGDPTRPDATAIFSDMLRQVEERAAASPRDDTTTGG